jgi:hypothetical protein
LQRLQTATANAQKALFWQASILTLLTAVSVAMCTVALMRRLQQQDSPQLAPAA